MTTLFCILKEIKLAFLNLFRNKRRTILTLFSVIVGTAFLMGFEGYVNKMEVDFRDECIRNGIGHFQIYKKGFEKNNQQFSMKFSFSPEEIEKIANIFSSLQQEVDFVAPRINISGLIGTGRESSIFIGHAGVPEYEQKLGISPLNEKKGLSNKKLSDAVLAINLVEKLKTEIGKSLTLTTRNEFGGLEAINIRVSSKIDLNNPQLNDMYVITHLKAAQQLLYSENIQYFIVMLKDIKYIDKVISDCNRRFEAEGIMIEIKIWKDIAYIYTVAVSLFKILVNMALIVIMFVVIFSISNTIFMSVMERIPEIGTLRSIGMSKTQMLRIILLESLFIGLLGLIVSVVLVLTIQPILNSLNLTLPPAPGVPYETPIKIMVTFGTIIKFSILNLTVTLIASILPALKAANLNIADSLRHL